MGCGTMKVKHDFGKDDYYVEHHGEWEPLPSFSSKDGSWVFIKNEYSEDGYSECPRARLIEGFLPPLSPPNPVSVHYNGTATIVDFDDGSTSKAICKKGEVYDEFSGLMAAIANRFIKGNRKKKIERLMEGASRVNQPESNITASEVESFPFVWTREDDELLKEKEREISDALRRYCLDGSGNISRAALMHLCDAYECLLEGLPFAAESHLMTLMDADNG